MRKLTFDQMAELGLRSLTNARRLLEDSCLLRNSGRFASSFILVGLSADELGKHILATSFFGAYDGADEDWESFWRRFRKHQEKLGNALWSAWIGDLFTEESPPDVEQFHRRRLAATYVDIDHNGAVSSPVEIITSADLDSIIQKIDTELAFCEKMLEGATADSLGRTLETLHSSLTGVRSVVSGLSSVGRLGHALALRSGLSKEDALHMAKIAEEVFRSPALGRIKDEYAP
jgi:AbiV family abortive infection protein